MTLNSRRAIVNAAAVISIHVAVLASQPPPAGSANPELVGQLSKELGSTPAQAEGAAGALFGLAKLGLKPELVSKAIPVLRISWIQALEHEGSGHTAQKVGRQIDPQHGWRHEAHESDACRDGWIERAT